MEIIFEQILILILICFAGIIAFRFKAVSASHAEGLVKVIMKITLPLLIFTSFAGTKLNDEILINFPIIFASAIFSVSILFLLSKISAKILKLDRENTALHNTHTMFGNVVFLGFPLLDALYPGGEGLIYATIFQIGNDALLWTWGVFILNKAAKQQKEFTIKHIINPATVAFVIGAVFMIFKIRIPELIFKPLFGLGHTTIYLSMIYVGIVLAQIKLKPLIQNLRSYILSFNKLLVAPIILMFVFILLKSTGINISDVAITCAVLQTAMPCMVIISILAEDLGLNSKQAVENILVSSVLSIITLPGVYWLAEMIM
ncbi:MAG TPA: AEC family transporter [Bacteroidales bacterium]|nr:AEC family transporter [Bacteroidales bacterium]